MDGCCYHLLLLSSAFNVLLVEPRVELCHFVKKLEARQIAVVQKSSDKLENLAFVGFLFGMAKIQGRSPKNKF